MDAFAPTSCSMENSNRQLIEQFKRVASVVVILPPLLLFLYYAPPVFFFVLILVLTGISLREYFHILDLACLTVYTSVSYIVAFLLVFSAYMGGELWMSRMLSMGIAVLVLNAMMTSRDASQRFSRALQSLFGVLFIAWGLSHLILLRGFADGKWYIFFLCVIVWTGDTTAMYVGKGFGRHKMAPSLSPGKTWEGAVGGLLGSLVAACLGARILAPGLILWQSLIIGLLVSFAAQISDLSESMIKRYAGVKDSGELIPGHGGLLDRIDSVLFAAPMLTYALDFLLHTHIL